MDWAISLGSIGGVSVLLVKPMTYMNLSGRSVAPLARENNIKPDKVLVSADDLDMRVTHVVRGADHISNTPKQILMYQALEAPVPIFAHLPLILGPDKQRLSKRHGATSVGAYQEQGVLPEALVNFLALLGWTPPGQKEIVPIAEMIRDFEP